MHKIKPVFDSKLGHSVATVNYVGLIYIFYIHVFIYNWGGSGNRIAVGVPV